MTSRSSNSRNGTARGWLIRTASLVALAGALIFGVLGSGLTAAAEEGHDQTGIDQAPNTGRGGNRDDASQTLPDTATGGETASVLTIGTAAIVNDEPVNLRAEASTQTSILAQLSTGTTVTITGGPVTGELTWYQVDTDQGLGWVASQYLTGTEESAGAESDAATDGTGAGTDDTTDAGTGFAVGTAVVVEIDGLLNLRAVAGLDAEVVAELPSGTAATIVSGPESADDLTWYQIETADGTGWVASDYLALT